MLLEKMTIKNFRQFYDTQTIVFSTSPTRNVTVIHGENGSGKTALLNAFSWCFYEKMDLPNANFIINEQALKEANPNDEVECFVMIEFIHHEKEYCLKRKVTAKVRHDGTALLGETVTGLEYKRDGNTETIANTIDEINHILPENLRTYFFFDGERIDNLAKDNNTAEIEKAIKNIMGLEILERAIRHTDQAGSRFRTELKNYGDPETKHIIEEIEHLESRKKKLIEKKNQLLTNLKMTKQQMKDTEARLKQIEGSQILQEEKEQKEVELDDTRSNLKKITKELQETVSKYGYLAFSFSPIKKAEEILKGRETEGHAVTGIRSASFIDDLLEKGECICGEKLTAGSSHYEHLLKVKEHLPPQNLDVAIINFKSGIKSASEDRQRFYDKVKSLKKEEINLYSKERMILEEIKEIKSKLNENDSEEVASLVAKINKLEELHNQINRDIGGLEHEIEEIAANIHVKEKEQKKLSTLENKAQTAQRRIEACKTLVNTMEALFKVREKIVKQSLQERITEVYKQFLRKGYEIKLDNNYQLTVYNQNNSKVAMSQGERQITSLSFIGAIVDLAREQYRKEVVNPFDEGGIYPLVMDSPFGALDSDHRKRIAKGIHKLSDQVIVIVSTSQWRGEVEEQMMDLIGKEYQLEYNDPRKNKDMPYEYTHIVEVTN